MVRLFVAGSHTRKQLKIVARYGPGEYIGEGALLAKEVRTQRSAARRGAAQRSTAQHARSTAQHACSTRARHGADGAGARKHKLHVRHERAAPHHPGKVGRLGQHWAHPAVPHWAPVQPALVLPLGAGYDQHRAAVISIARL